MKKILNNQKGFVIPLVIAIVAILAVGGTVYLAEHKELEAPIVIDTNVPTQATTTVTATTTVSTSTTSSIITSISPASGPIGTIITITGSNLNGFEGDMDIWIQNGRGEVGLAALIPGFDIKSNYPTFSSQSFKIKIDSRICEQASIYYSGLSCKSYMDILPGNYTLYTSPWGNKSNEVKFTVTATEPEKPIFCAMDAVMCPNGTYVGRSGPKCEFVCPAQSSCVKEGGEINTAKKLVTSDNRQCCPGLIAKEQTNLPSDAPDICSKP